MYIRDLVASMVRRWYFLAAGLVLTAALCFLAFRLAPVTYESTGSVLLLPPKSSVGSRGNPFLYLGGLGQAAEVLTARLNAAEVRVPLETAHPDATFEIGPDPTTTGPILTVTVESTSREDSLATTTAALAAVPSTLTTLQTELAIPQGSQITVMALTVIDEPEMVVKTRNRAVIAVAGLGIAGTVLLTGFLDGLVGARRQRRDLQPRTSPDIDGKPNGSDPDTTDATQPQQPVKTPRRKRQTPEPVIDSATPDWS